MALHYADHADRSPLPANRVYGYEIVHYAAPTYYATLYAVHADGSAFCRNTVDRDSFHNARATWTPCTVPADAEYIGIYETRNARAAVQS